MKKRFILSLALCAFAIGACTTAQHPRRQKNAVQEASSSELPENHVDNDAYSEESLSESEGRVPSNYGDDSAGYDIPEEELKDEESQITEDEEETSEY